jgi:hypothetical protein
MRSHSTTNKDGPSQGNHPLKSEMSVQPIRTDPVSMAGLTGQQDELNMRETSINKNINESLVQIEIPSVNVNNSSRKPATPSEKVHAQS